ncbi:hypothetical protein NXS08_05605 [Gleimia sp. 6138-11-ORH1]|uniref:zinc ribbon domain-containing protein n=1 Tax=Gleimia sp. 6138-11-ORH1 TaxID=2973937 RepID=UPI00216796A5|nr:hypothetical protein [Gleimia sp. 6138-11-ORH1]MCS4484946.1 hypothetical protein [Gleimia sp. 6138-11-ORH1]
MRASKSAQQALLELQELDTRIGQLGASRKKHPAFVALTELAGRKSDLERAGSAAKSTHGDIKRELSVYEVDMEKLQARQDVMGKRLESGQGSPKELVAIQHELNQMAARREKLETKILEVMTRLEKAAAAMEAIQVQVQALAEDAGKARDEYTAAMGAVDAELKEKQSRRKEIAAQLDDELLDEYEHCQQRSGIGVVAAQGRQLVGMQNALSEYEWHQIHSLGAEEIFYSEDMECLIVKIDE